MHLANKPKFILSKKKLSCVESGQDYVSPHKKKPSFTVNGFDGQKVWPLLRKGYDWIFFF